MSVLLISDSDHVRTLILNRPDKRNALNDELIAELKSALREADADECLRAIVIRGAGKDFCSGADLASLQKIAGATYEENIEDARSLGELFELILSDAGGTLPLYDLPLTYSDGSRPQG